MAVAKLKVEEKPRVTLTVSPAASVSENLNANVTLTCQQQQAKNHQLRELEPFLAVNWYLDGSLLRHIERDDTATSTSGGGSSVEPSQIILLNVSRSFRGNYSCRGRNAVGWGALSEPRELKVLYPPRGAGIRQEPDIVSKGKQFKVGIKRKAVWRVHCVIC